MARRIGSWELFNERKWEEVFDVWELWKFFLDIFQQTKKSEYKNIYEKLDDEKKKKVVKLICMVKGQKIEEEKVVEDFEISIDDIELVLERAKKVVPKLVVENINE
jgi:NACalpha-BTF3-like transcription factor